MNFRPPTWLGWAIAFGVLIITGVLAFMGMMPKEHVLLIAAICAVRL